MEDKDLNEVSQEILPIERSAIHRISSGQGILDLAGAVKELVENSLDAGANRIDIRLKNYGADLIEVADNGPGVSPRNYQALTLKHYTSKIVKFTDLRNLSSFGFRGEALSSLCALSRVTISTRTANESIGMRLEYDLSGILVTKEPIARCVGTTVAVSKLFFPLPVRETELRRHVRPEFGRLVTVLRAYALISKRIRLLCTNNVGTAGRTTVVQTLGSLSVRDNIISVFGTKTIKCLQWIDLSISDQCSVDGFLSKPSAGSGRGSRDRQFFFVNGRPVDLPKAATVLNQLYRSFNPRQFPMVIINFTLPTTAYDINVSPDKRKVFLHNEADLMKGLIAALQEDYAPVVNATATEKKRKKKVVEPSSVQQVPPAVRSNENAKVTIEPEADGGNPCEGLGQDGEEVPLSSTSDSAKYGKHSFGDPYQDEGVEREEVPIISTSDPAGYENDSCGGRGDADREDVPILSSSDAAEYGMQQLNPPGKFSFQLKPSRPSLRLKSFGQNSGNAILSSDSLSGVPSRTSTLEVQANSTVQSRLSELVSRCKRPLEESGKRPLKDSGEWPRLKPCGLNSKNAPNEDTSKPQQIQPNNSRQVNLSRWFTGSSESDAYQGAGSSKSKSRLQKMRLRRKHEGGTAEATDFSLEPQVEVLSELPDETRTQQLDQELGKVSSLHTECGNGEADELQNPLIGQLKEKPLATRPDRLKQTSSVLRFNRLSAAEVNEAGSRPNDSSVLKIDLERLQRLSNLGFLSHENKERLRETTKKKSFTFAAIGDDRIAEPPVEKCARLEAATNELQQKLEKTDFKRMKVVGQFDLRFILVTLDRDMFILDQHASDEIYNFEHIMRTAVVDSQPLPKSVPLELNAADQVIVETNIKTFRKNGFDFRRKRQRAGGHNLHLSTVPSCSNDILGVEDVKELISSLASRPSIHSSYPCTSSSWLARPSRLRAMFASQACQASRMVGDALSKKEMEQVVSRLAELEAPWTCPHGRPTIRHMFDLDSLVTLSLLPSTSAAILA
ncbi:unnamed protein product [Calypogeia fissa]